MEAGLTGDRLRSRHIDEDAVDRQLLRRVVAALLDVAARDAGRVAVNAHQARVRPMFDVRFRQQVLRVLVGRLHVLVRDPMHRRGKLRQELRGGERASGER